jgi:Ca2+:H+ antiporter
MGGLLNATFRNAPELIISLAALTAGSTELVRTSTVGAILSNLRIPETGSALMREGR